MSRYNNLGPTLQKIVDEYVKRGTPVEFRLLPTMFTAQNAITGPVDQPIYHRRISTGPKGLSRTERIMDPDKGPIQIAAVTGGGRPIVNAAGDVTGEEEEILDLSLAFGPENDWRQVIDPAETVLLIRYLFSKYNRDNPNKAQKKARTQMTPEFGIFDEAGEAKQKAEGRRVLIRVQAQVPNLTRLQMQSASKLLNLPYDEAVTDEQLETQLLDAAQANPLQVEAVVTGVGQQVAEILAAAIKQQVVMYDPALGAYVWVESKVPIFNTGHRADGEQYFIGWLLDGETKEAAAALAQMKRMTKWDKKKPQPATA